MMLSDGWVEGRIVVESLAFAGADPPPEALTELFCGDEALPATLTVTMKDG